MQRCIELMREALASLARGEVLLPLRPVLRLPDTRNVYALMPAYSKALNAIGTKLITVFPDNHGTDLDSHQGAVILIDGERGNLKALMDAASITAIRTAAVSGVATDLLARRDATTLAVLGSGVQARTHIEAMLAVRRFTNVLVWSRNADHARALVAGVGPKRGVPLEVVPDAESAVRRADVICTVTASPKPVLHGEWLRPGSHVNAVGASLPTTRELDSDAVRRARVWVDRRESALNEAGDLLVPIQEGVISADHILGEIGALLSGHDHGRKNDTEITLFKSLGLAIEDLASAHYLHQRATDEQAGTWVDL
jgi:ornithine cyclodeaminase/alanine dehydrogenase-like protein (mu-crystallin family)